MGHRHGIREDLPGGEKCQRFVSGSDLVLAVGGVAGVGHRHGIHEETYLVVRKVSGLSRGRISYWLLAGLPAWGTDMAYMKRLTWW